MERVVITGMGIISPIGNDITEYAHALKTGKNGIGKITRYDAEGSKAKLAAEVKGFDALQYYDSVLETRRADLFTQYAIAAATQAVEQSGIVGHVDQERLGVYFGSGIGGIDTFRTEADNLREKGERRVSSLFIPMMISNMAAGAISIRFGAKGASLPVVTACATSTNAIGEAYRAIKHGYADAIIAGGSEAAINPLAMAGFTNCKALSLSEDASCASLPFDKRRGGFVMGEGAGALVLESLSCAQKRGAKILAEIVGYGNTADAYHMTAPSPDGEGAGRAIWAAKTEAGMSGSEPIYVNAHGTGTPANDKMETLAYKRAFGKDAYGLHISSTKSMTGHMLGAAGAAEAVACVIALTQGFIPPTINLCCPDEACDLNYTPNAAVNVQCDYALSASFGFGGHNAVLAFRRYND